MRKCSVVAVLVAAVLVAVSCGPVRADIGSHFDAVLIGNVHGGLVVHVGTTDGWLESEAAATGKVLVHGLALDDAALAKSRSAIRARGLYGLASVERAGSLNPLPYADNLVNRLVVEGDALGAKTPRVEELLRVIAPGGAVLVRKGGEIKTTTKPRPAEMDDWSHFDHGPDGNGVSRDRLVRPSTFVQWTAGVQPIKLGGNPAAFQVYTGIRVAEGQAFFEWGAGEKGKRETWFSGRDAFSGLPLWNVPSKAGGRKDWQFVAGKDRLFTFLEDKGLPVALDAATGAVVRTFDQGGRRTEEIHQTALRLCGDTLLETCGNTLYAMDSDTGNLRWKYEEAEGGLLFPVADPKSGKVFAAVADSATRGSSRWPVAKAKAIVCLDLASGKPLWRCAEMKDLYVGQMVPSGEHLALFASGAIGGGEEPLIGAIRAADGKLLWHTTFKKEYNRFGYNMLVRDGTLYYADAWRIYAHDLKTGEASVPFDDRGYNMRCNRFCATPDRFLYGFGGWVGKDWQGLFQHITRSGCALGAVPANGMLYYTPNACGCLAELRGHMALSSEPVRAAIPDAARLTKPPSADTYDPPKEPSLLDGFYQDTEPAPPPQPPPFDAKAAQGLIAQEWAGHPHAAGKETPPVTARGKTFTAVIHEHRIECRDDKSKVVWSFTAGGRIVSAPIVVDDLCLFGCTDGWVYCVNADSGQPLWRFMAAPYERKVVAYGQLESSWPVYGVVLHQGLVCASAGVHPEVGGGIYAYGLEPKTGAIAWKKVLARSAIAFDPKARTRITPNRILNDVLASDGQTLSLPGITFDPKEPDADTQRKVDNLDEGKKKGR